MAAEKRILAFEEPQKHPDYQYFAESGEEQFHTFVGIPLFDHNHSIGVLVIQTLEPHTFSEEELATLSTIAFQVASIVVNARLLDAIDRYGQQETTASATVAEVAGAELQQPNTFRGHAAYPGVVTGPANIIDQQFGFSDIFDECNIDPPAELKRLDEALRKTRIQTLYLEKRVAEQLTQEDAAIFHTHLMILEDRGFIDRLHELIEEQHSAPYALKRSSAAIWKPLERWKILICVSVLPTWKISVAVCLLIWLARIPRVCNCTIAESWSPKIITVRYGYPGSQYDSGNGD